LFFSFLLSSPLRIILQGLSYVHFPSTMAISYWGNTVRKPDSQCLPTLGAGTARWWKY
jgi:hypothetical protein